MKRLAILLVGAILALALTGVGPEDRRVAHRAASDAVAAVRSMAQSGLSRVNDWRRSRQDIPADATEGAGPLAPASGSGVMLAGTFRPSDTEVEGRLGAVTFEYAEVRFQRGLVLKTEPYRLLTADQIWSGSGMTYAQATRAPPAAQIEVRRVTEAESPQGMDIGCGPGLTPDWLAIRQETDRVTLMLMHGAAAPGNGMAETALCGTGVFVADR